MADGGHLGPAKDGVLLTDAKRDDANPIHGPSQIQIKWYNRNSGPAGESSRRRTKMILGGQVYINEWAEWRIKWSQRGIGVFSFLGIVGYIISGFARNSTLRSLSLASVMVALAFVGHPVLQANYPQVSK